MTPGQRSSIACDVDPETYPDSWQATDEALLGDGKEKYGVTYRVLGEGDSA